MRVSLRGDDNFGEPARLVESDLNLSFRGGGNLSAVEGMRLHVGEKVAADFVDAVGWRLNGASAIFLIRSVGAISLTVTHEVHAAYALEDLLAREFVLLANCSSGCNKKSFTYVIVVVVVVDGIALHRPTSVNARRLERITTFFSILPTFFAVLQSNPSRIRRIVKRERNVLLSQLRSSDPSGQSRTLSQTSWKGMQWPSAQENSLSVQGRTVLMQFFSSE